MPLNPLGIEGEACLPLSQGEGRGIHSPQRASDTSVGAHSSRTRPYYEVCRTQWKTAI